MSRTVTQIATIAMRAVLGIAGLAVFTALLLSAFGQIRALTVLSGSMRPTLPIGSVVIERPVASSHVHVGDVLTFTRPDGRSLTTHRIVDIEQLSNGQTVAHTKGDDNNAPDPWQVVLSGHPAWRVVGNIPTLGYVLSWIRTRGFFRVAAIAVPILLAAVWLIQIWRPTPTAPQVAPLSADG